MALSSSCQYREGRAHPTRRDIDIANAMSCHVPRFCLADVDVCPAMDAPFCIFSIPSASLCEVARCHVRPKNQNPIRTTLSCPDIRMLASATDMDWLPCLSAQGSLLLWGIRAADAALSAWPMFQSRAQQYHDTSCSPSTVAGDQPTELLLRRHGLDRKCCLRTPKPIPSRPTFRLTWMTVDMDSASSIPTELLCSAILRERGCSLAVRQYSASLTRWRRTTGDGQVGWCHRHDNTASTPTLTA